MQVAADSSSLIYLGKLDRLPLLERLYSDVLIAPSVWEETIQGGKEVHPVESAQLERSLREYELIDLTYDEVRLSQLFRMDLRLGAGEAEVIAVSSIRGCVAMVDEKRARAAAVRLGVRLVGTVGVLLAAREISLLSYDELLDLLRRLASVAWVSPDIMARVIQSLREEEGI
ncbi:MAG: hypothetical protein FJ319_09080 [SAR202 cluster bacterium]|nr:hypothetical protein [SAR202 cluster bacterium]